MICFIRFYKDYEEKSLPKVFKAPKAQKRQFNDKRKSDSPFKKNKPNQQRSFNNNSKNSTKTFAGAPRQQKQNGGHGQKHHQSSRGAQNVTAKQNGERKSVLTKAKAVANMQKAYDFSKIAGKLEHFGSCTPDVQLMLNHQLDKRGIKVTKKEEQ